MSTLRIMPLLIMIVSIEACTHDPVRHKISFSDSDIIIDGDPSDEGWSGIYWQEIHQVWLGDDPSPSDFEGRYKVAWTEDHLLVLAEITDDILIDQSADGLDRYWDDDCLEVFIDEDASGGDHQYNYNAFAYHISLDNKVVDIGVDSLPHYYDHVKCVRKTDGHTSIWELSIDLYDDGYQHSVQNKKVQLHDNKVLGFAIAYCDNDNSPERENFIGSTYVKGPDKNRGWIDAEVFQTYTLTKEK